MRETCIKDVLLGFKEKICELNCKNAGTQDAGTRLNNDEEDADGIRKTEWSGVNAVEPGCRQMGIDGAACI
jgi:hypothetical protein